ncbi:hypothetical protein ACTVLM_24035 [Serratia marcescens]|uniref:hypothetical protein n=1 Tax=Serratia marcescens TaxID=615 RepID=UPI003FA72B5A
MKLRAQLKRPEEGRDILEKATRYFARVARLKYRFINQHRALWDVMTMCRLLHVAQVDIFDYIEAFHNRARHYILLLGGVSPGTIEEASS